LSLPVSPLIVRAVAAGWSVYTRVGIRSESDKRY